MKKIILSLGVMVFAGAMVVSATGAFFNDTETSTGNTFASGAIDLKIDSESHYAGLTCVDGTWVEDQEGQSTRQDLIGEDCDGTWEQKDLGPTGSSFFNFFDLKPGDSGENTLSLHVFDNDAWMCVTIDNMHDDDLGLTEPEQEDGDNTDGADNGELAPELHFFAWLDQGLTAGFSGDDEGEGDNIWDGQTAEPSLFSNIEGPASDVLDGVVYPLFAPGINNSAVMMGTTTYYIGLYWCYGDITVGDGTLECDGSPVTNISQTDQLTADISFYAEQARNNPNFVCPGLDRPETATLTIDKIVSFSNDDIAGVDVPDFELHINGPGGDQILTDETPLAGLAAGVYTVSEVYSDDPSGVIWDAQFSGACTDDGQTGTITLNPGDNVTCTINNVVELDPEA